MSNQLRGDISSHIRNAGKARAIIGALLFLFSGTAGDALGQKRVRDGVTQSGHDSSNREIVVAGRTMHVPDVWVVTQDGKRVQFYSDLIKDKSVAVGFFFTSCLSVCTWHGKLFSRFQKHLAGRLGEDIFLISVSIDPLTDTPARLKRWGTKYNRQSGWTLVTGGKAEMNELLKSMTGDNIGPQEVHSSFFYIYNANTGRWGLISGYPTPEEFEKQLAELGKAGT